MSTKRAVDLAAKLQFAQNEGLRPRVVEWVKKSKAWATAMFNKYGPNQAQKDVDGYRLLYVLNHLCPSLYHFHKMPNPLRFQGDIDGYNRAARKQCERLRNRAKNAICLFKIGQAKGFVL